jgi:hypothetical protein
MKRFLFLAVVLCFALLSLAQTPWQYGRIVSVAKSVSSTTKAWVVNTPLDEETTHFTVAVHVQDKIVVGTYELSDAHPAPPPEWTRDFPVKVQFVQNALYVRSATGNVQLHITQRKAAGVMQPITAEEKKQMEALDVSLDSLIGFSKSGDSKSAKTESPAAPQAPPPPPAPATTGMVTVRSTPYLSEVFVDGDSMGYTPAKIALGPGKHTFRVEKPGYRVWTKEMAVTIGSELTLDATLEKK